jgi:hypothetical protein
MAFDLSNVINQAQEVTSQQQNGDGKNQIRLIYPGTGTLKVKLLYNPKSNLVARQIKRHKVGNTNYTCLGMYGMDCPICKMVDSIKNSTGLDLWKYNAKTRGLTYAQYVGSQNYTWDNNNKEPQVGELILLMYPWTIYQDINRIISTAGVNADQLIARNEGKVVNIIRWRENSQEKYKCEVDAFAAPFRSCEDDQKFDQYLSDLPDLNEAIVSSQANQDTFKYANEASEALSREYLRGTQYGGMPGMNPAQNQMSGGTPGIIDDGQGHQFALVNGQYVPINAQPQMNQQVPPANPGFTPGFVPQNNIPPQLTPQNTAPAYTPSTPVSQPQNAEPTQQFSGMNPPTESGGTPQQSAAPTDGNGKAMPECFGHHKDGDNKCLACMYEIQCLTMA